MVSVRVLVASTAKDMAAELILDAVSRSAIAVCLLPRVVAVPDILRYLGPVAPIVPCALVVVGPLQQTRAVAARWNRRRKRLVIAEADINNDLVRITAHNAGMEGLLAALGDLFSGRGWRSALRPGPQTDDTAAATEIPLPAARDCRLRWRPAAAGHGARRAWAARAWVARH